MDTMQYGEFIARIEYDEDAESFHGRVVNLPEVVDFWGDSVQELHEEFRRSVDTYASVCRDRGIEPSRPYSGTFNLRLGPDLHRKVALSAAREGKSIAEWVRDRLAAAAEEPA